MATTAPLPPPGAAATNGSGDLFTSTPSHAAPAALRYAAFDHDQFSLYSTNSPSSARRALEAHLQDTDRRIQDASRLGSTLVKQRKDLAARLQDVEQMQQESELPIELQEKLTELEREYNEVGRESARAFLPKPRVASETGQDAPALISGSGRDSPTKLSAPSRRQRNQPTNRVHDIEFATEISTSLLAQVRQLQAALVERDAGLRDVTASRAQVEAEAANLIQRIRHMDENEQKYKDETWNLETRLQEMEATLKESMDKESRLAQTLKSTQMEKAAKERELDDLKVTHDKLHDDHAMAKKVQEADLYGLRRDVAGHETEKQRMQKKIEELTAQNTELARAVSYRFNQAAQPSDTDFVSAEEAVQSDDQGPHQSEPASPIKGTPARHGIMETETIKSSLNHAHRMIQNLKNTIHREKTEKIELKRMLQDARDEIETRRENAGVSANVAKKRSREPEGVKFKRPANIGRLGAARSSTTEIVNEPDWEDQDQDQTPSKPRPSGSAVGAAFSRSEDDTTDAFETANERETTTESEAFATGNEDFDDDTEGEATETESGAFSGLRSINSLSSHPKDRRSFMSTASTSGDEDDDLVKTPVHSAQPKYKLRMSRGSRRSGRVGDTAVDSPYIASNDSPSSGTGTPQPVKMQSLGDELDALDEDSLQGTPISGHMLDDELNESTTAMEQQLSRDPDTPAKAHALEPALSSPFVESHSSRKIVPTFPSGSPEPAVVRSAMVDTGIMTEPWEPERIIEERIVEKIVEAPPKQTSLAGQALEIAGGALAGLGLGKAIDMSADAPHQADPGAARQLQDEQSIPQAPMKPLHVSVGTDAYPEQRPNDVRDETHTHSESKFANISVGSDVHPDPETFSAQTNPPTEMPRTFSEVPKDDELVSPHADTSVVSGPDARASDVVTAAEIAPAAMGSGVHVHAASETESTPVNLSFSPVVAQDFEPVLPEPLMAFAPEPSSARQSLKDVISPAKPVGMPHEDHAEDIPGTASARVGAGFLASAAAPTLSESVSDSTPELDQNFERNLGSGEDPKDFAPEDAAVLPAVDARAEAPLDQQLLPRPPLAVVDTNVLQGKSMIDGGSQTLVTGEEIDGMLRIKNAVVPLPAPTKDAGSSPFRGAALSSVPGLPNSTNDERFPNAEPSVFDSPTIRAPRRPGSAGSTRIKPVFGAPPLPADHTEKIAAAAQQAPVPPTGQQANVTMGPPLMPASAYRSRPKTPTDRPTYERRVSRDGTTPRAVRTKDSRGQVQSDRVSHRSSVSSFASELDERFNITRGQIMYPADVEPSTDPRMIQAITQTMIGEYLWKYTRKAGRSETSSTRHRRFFWVHPYTRTLYWSEQDPSTAGKNMLKAKSVAVEAVRVTSDDNAYPPGLHRKSLVVVTPGREIVFTAPTGQRHETWFNALSYLLLRTEQEKLEAEDTIAQDDIDEFNPGMSRNFRRSIGRIAGRSQSRQSRASLSSYNSRTTRTTSPQRQDPDRTPTQRHGAGTVTQKTMQPSGDGANGAAVSKDNRASSGSVASRFSSFTSRFRPAGTQRARSSASLRRPEDPAQIYEASVVDESAEDLRTVIERQEREADRLENVRACCDGKHDVGSLSRNQRHSSLGNRFGSHGHHSHSHPHRS